MNGHLDLNLRSTPQPTVDRDRVFYLWAVILFSLQGVSQFAMLEFLPPDFPPVSDSGLLIAGGLAILFGVPFGLMLPKIRVDGLSASWGVPRATFLLSRPLARIVTSSAIGIAIGGAMAFPFVGMRSSLLVVATVTTAGCMVMATTQRFRRHRCTEWTMPLPGYKLVRPLIRGSRADA